MAKRPELDARALQIALLEKMARRLDEIDERLREQLPEGEVDNADPQSVTEEVSKIDVVRQFGHAWFSFDLFNRGPNDALAAVNRFTTFRRIIPFSTWRGEVQRGKVRFIYLKTDAAGSATVDISGVW